MRVPNIPRDIDAAYRLEDRYQREQGSVFLTGTQALVRILFEQARVDRRAGLNTAGLVSGYRGSPLGGLDQELWRQKKLLKDADIRFEPGLNEDLGATMLWGAQQLDAFPGKRVDGVFSMWYGKGPGVDRTGDVFRNANILGTSKHGGVLAVAGDDHAAQSSMFPHQTDHVFEGAMMPILFPASVDEYLDFGLAGYAMSRFSGLWVAYKAITETVESGRSMPVDEHARNSFITPTDIAIPSRRGFNYDPALRWPVERAELERRVLEERLPAALAFARANPFDRVVFRSKQARVGIVTVGKAHGDVLAALAHLGLDTAALDRLGIALYKVGMTWPLESEGVRQFARGLSALLVVEEKRSFVERQIKEALYDVRAAERPEVFGKTLGTAGPLVPAALEISPAIAAATIARFCAHTGVALPPAPVDTRSTSTRKSIPILSGKEAELLTRKPFFCAGCPHNTSTKLPDGSYAAAGIGCHIMALGESPGTATFCQMGGEGIQWIGMSTFTDLPHMFVNLGDGTYQHSGSLAIRQAVAAKANVTYKILFNDAVAMTGGQPTEGGLTVARVVAQVLAEGVASVTIVSDDPAKYASLGTALAGVEIEHRDTLDAVQRRLRERKGVTVLVYEQTCAAEKRRRRKRGTLPTPPARVVIHPDVCEGCGDCSVQSNCIAIEPLDTERGRKRTVNQSSCNKDLSCTKGFCPSFVTVEGLAPRKPDRARIESIEPALREQLAAPLPVSPEIERHARIVVTGIGGTGVVTIGAILAMAAHLEGRGASTLDFTGLAQKNGAVLSHVQIASSRGEIATSRIETRSANVLLGCDAVVAASPDALSRVVHHGTHAVVNTHITPTAEFVKHGDLAIGESAYRRTIESALGDVSPAISAFWNCNAAAEAIFGDAIASNMMMVGFAYQRGLIPLSEAAIHRAIELNGASVAMNQRAFLWGRLIAHDPTLLDKVSRVPDSQEAPFELDAFVAARIDDLTAYQNAAYAKRYAQLVTKVKDEEARVNGACGALTEAVARSYYKVLTYKDEYEVARLHTDGSFKRRLAAQFEGDAKLTYHMAPPVLSRKDSTTGRRSKRAFDGRWMQPLLAVLKHGKVLRGTLADPFARQSDRRMERALIREFEDDVQLALSTLAPHSLKTAIDLAALPMSVRGFGIVKENNYRAIQPHRGEYRATLAEGLCRA
ncbi:indolepyruvate ferredoxin oxidoreductase family protein [Paraburkholderia antibiotica]|uniref:Indolepyruvate ferredoxin oxidoreductase family protein n=1 Tax=Paraburkholderia antibiotica TaxID=2728839 RepID=A0A7X9X310_9BURK|nr:indolepyruvate ferredoxin oxidoreductase family protein [Paraburkholderia antibiotica]NML30523.1 indolepyruvate ferredoxin oxidoreductase family protein [Paraburkholderia antibiotica]